MNGTFEELYRDEYIMNGVLSIAVERPAAGRKIFEGVFEALGQDE